MQIKSFDQVCNSVHYTPISEGKPRKVTAVSDSISASDDISSTIICGSEGTLLNSLDVSECLSGIQNDDTNWLGSYTEYKDMMINRIVRIVDFPVVSVVLPKIRFHHVGESSVLSHIHREINLMLWVCSCKLLGINVISLHDRRFFVSCTFFSWCW